MKGKKSYASRSPSGSDLLIKRTLKQRVETLKKLAETISSQIDLLGDADLLGDSSKAEDLSFYDAVKQFEITLINEALDRTQGHQKRAAHLLGLLNTTLNSMIKRYNIQHPSWNDRAESDSATLNGDRDNYVF